jgi:D-serine deaminase-like pyridoxal phosphate-dependent protein
MVGVARECALHSIDQILIAKRLLQEVERTVLDRLDGHWDIAMSADENNRNDRTALIEFGLEFDTTHAWHAYVEHETAGLIGIPCGKEFVCGGVGDSRQSDRFQQQPQRAAHRIIVIYYVHGGGTCHRGVSPE